MLIAVYAQPEFREDFAQVLMAYDVEFADTGLDLLSSLQSFDARCFDRFVIMDDVVDDHEVISALDVFVNSPRAELSNMLPVFVSNALREQPSEFYSKLILGLGVDQVIAHGSADEDYDYFGSLVRSLRFPLRRSDVKRLCCAPAASGQAHAPKGEERASSIPATLGRPIAKRIVFAQPAPRNGSTHTAFACASALSKLGFSVALVAEESLVVSLRQCYPSMPFDEALGVVQFGDISIYSGDSPSEVPEGFDYILCDQGVTYWLYAHDDPARRSRGEAQLDIYRRADLSVMCSLVSPTGAWEFGRERIKALGPRAMNRTTFSAFGVPNEEVEALFRRRVLDLGGTRFISMPYIPAPLFRSSDAVHPAILDLLSPVLGRRGFGVVQVEADPAPEPKPATRAGLRGLFKRREPNG